MTELGIMLPEEANIVYDILVEECGALERERRTFLRYYVRVAFQPQTEWRFQGNIGFGGKFYTNSERWYVSCYPEEETPEILSTIARANERLAHVREQWGY